jgi:hypothetical protein
LRESRWKDYWLLAIHLPLSHARCIKALKSITQVPLHYAQGESYISFFFRQHQGVGCAVLLFTSNHATQFYSHGSYYLYSLPVADKIAVAFYQYRLCFFWLPDPEDSHEHNCDAAD